MTHAHAHPHPAAPPEPASRRGFVGGLMAGVGAAVAAFMALPLVRFAWPQKSGRATETQWADLGAVEDFSPGAPVKRTIEVAHVDGWRKVVTQRSVYVIRPAGGDPKVLSSVCPHLGCSVPWNEAQGAFLCPCHQGRFSAHGALLGGPPPRSMDELESRVEAGRLKVRYQYFRQLVPAKEPVA